MFFYGAQYNHSGPISKNQKSLICRNYRNRANRCYGNLKFRVEDQQVICDVEHLAAFRAHGDHCEYSQVANPQLRALGKPEFGMYRGKALSSEIFDSPPVSKPVLNQKQILMRAIGLQEVKRPNDNRADQNQISEKKIKLLEGFRVAKECLDQMMTCLDELLKGPNEGSVTEPGRGSSAGSESEMSD